MVVMSAWTTNKPGYNEHREKASLPIYDRAFFKEEKSELEAMTSKEWHESVEEDTKDC